MRFIILLLLSFCISNAFANNPRGFYQAYQNINYSIRGGKMDFSCDNGLTQYRLQADFGSRAKLYWLSPEKKWLEIQDVIFNDTNINFESTTKIDGIAISTLSKNINLPIFDRGYKTIPSRYFYKVEKNKAQPYLFIIDMVERTSTAQNINPLEDIVMLDKRRYFLEQAYQASFKTNDSKQLATQKHLARERHQLLEAISLQYENGIRIATPPYQHKVKSRCYL